MKFVHLREWWNLHTIHTLHNAQNYGYYIMKIACLSNDVGNIVPRLTVCE